EKTFRSRIDRFGVTQPNIQKLEASGRILVELPGVKDKARVRELLQGTANLEFWETYENGEIAPLLDKANTIISAYLQSQETGKTDSTSVDASVSKTDSTKADTNLVAKTTPSVNPQDTAIANFKKRVPLYSFYQNAFP